MDDNIDRAAKGGGKSTDISQQQLIAAPSQTQPQGPSAGIQRGTPADWFGPLDPLNPIAPPEVAGRQFDFPSGFNLATTPRAWSSIGFPTLRGLADGYDILRIIIEARKDEMERMKWTIKPRDPAAKLQGELKARTQALEKFFMRPDRVHFWGQWLRMLLEDLFVIDAPTIFKRRTKGGDIYALEVIDGATIKRVIDDYGRTPEYPVVAYQQNLKGFPAINYTTKDLLYRPRNMRAHAVYGYSPVEQILMTISIGIRREVFQLNYFTEGNMPEALVGVPDTWTPDQVRQMQTWWDSMMEGNLAQRRKMKFVPAGVGSKVSQLKDTPLFGEAEEWLARVCCFAFSISAQAFSKMMNRATAESAQEAAVTNGLYPVMNWVKDTINTILMDEFNETDLEFDWVEEDETDPVDQETILTGYMSKGVMTPNEVREKLGLDPDPNPNSNRQLVLIATGYIPVVKTPEEEQADAAKQQAIAGGAVDAKGKDVPPGHPSAVAAKPPTPPPGEGGTEGDKPGDAKKPATGAVPAKGDVVQKGIIRKVGGKWKLYAETGKVLGEFETRAEAEKAESEEISKARPHTHRHGHDISVNAVERVPQRDPSQNDTSVTFGKPASADVTETVLNAAAKQEPDWR